MGTCRQEPPGQPEKVLMTDLYRPATVCRQDSGGAGEVLIRTALPWQLKALIMSPRLSTACLRARALIVRGIAGRYECKGTRLLSRLKAHLMIMSSACSSGYLETAP